MDKRRLGVNLLLLAVLFYLSVYTSWYIAYSNGFYYPFIYSIYNIEDHVKKSASVHTEDLSSFSNTTAYEHFRLFNGLLNGVEHGGSGLENLKYHTESGSYRFLNNTELAQMQDVSSTIEFYKSLVRLFLLLMAAVCVYMVIGNVEAYQWEIFTRGMSIVFALFIVFVWLVGLHNLIGFLGGIIFHHQSDWFFYNPKSLPMLIMPYPQTFTCFFSIMAVSSLAVWAVYYKLCGWVIRLISRKNFR